MKGTTSSYSWIYLAVKYTLDDDSKKYANVSVAIKDPTGKDAVKRISLLTKNKEDYMHFTYKVNGCISIQDVGMKLSDSTGDF